VKLSEARATSVAVFLVGRGVPKERLQAAGFGSKQPIASNKTEEGRAKNRRVAFVPVSASATK
jgi:OmpA-OmpF porin, OOP family